MIPQLLRSAALATTLSLASLAASAQSFSDFLNKPELPVTVLGADFSSTRYYGPPLTVDQGEMKDQFSKINYLLEHEAKKYDIAGALHRKGEAVYALNVTEAVNKDINTASLIVPSDAAPRAPFTAKNVQDAVSHYNIPASSTGIGFVFVVESIDKVKEQEIFWVTFIDLNTKKVLYTEKMGGPGGGFGFRNHWAHPLDAGISLMDSHYGQWKKTFGKG